MSYTCGSFCVCLCVLNWVERGYELVEVVEVVEESKVAAIIVASLQGVDGQQWDVETRCWNQLNEREGLELSLINNGREIVSTESERRWRRRRPKKRTEVNSCDCDSCAPVESIKMPIYWTNAKSSLASITFNSNSVYIGYFDVFLQSPWWGSFHVWPSAGCWSSPASSWTSLGHRTTSMSSRTSSTMNSAVIAWSIGLASPGEHSEFIFSHKMSFGHSLRIVELIMSTLG